MARLRDDAADAEAHYGLARCYLFTGDPGPAALSARAAIRTSDDATLVGDALTALAYARLVAGEPGEARRAAELAIERGVTTGHLVLATLAEDNEAKSSRGRASAGADHRRQVNQGDLERYFGPRPARGEVVRRVLQSQRDKTGASARRFKRVASEQANQLKGRFDELSDSLGRTINEGMGSNHAG